MKKELSYRAANVEVDRAEDGSLSTVHATFSSDAPVRMFDWGRGEWVYEVLGHSDDEFDLGFMRSGKAPFLLDHDRDADSQIGVVERAVVSNGRGQAWLRLSRSARGQQIRQDIEDGIRTNISVGYIVREAREVGTHEGLPLIRATMWEPKEISLVTIPADTNSQIERKERGDLFTTNTNTDKQRKETITMSDKTDNTPEINVDKIREEAATQARNAENARVHSILGYASKWDMVNEAQEFIRNNKSAEDFKDYVLENLERKQQETPVKDNVPNLNGQRDEGAPVIGMSQKETEEYSLVRAIRYHAFPDSAKYRREAGLEQEASEAAEKLQPSQKRGSFVIPYDVLMHNFRMPRAQYAAQKRDLVVGGDSSPQVTDAGYYTVPTFTLSMIDILRSRLVTEASGATVLTGLTGDVSFPRHDTAAEGYWLDENEDITESTQGIGQVPLTPKTVGALNEYSRKLLIQSSIDVENFVRTDQAAVIARAIDRAALEGDGTDANPTGVASTAGVGTQILTFGNISYSEIVNMWRDVANANADFGSLNWVSSVNVAAELMTTRKDAGSGIFLLENGMLAGYPLRNTTGITSTSLIYGNWADLLIGMYGGLDVLVDPYTASASGRVRVVTFQSADVAVRHAGSFSVGTLTGSPQGS